MNADTLLGLVDRQMVSLSEIRSERTDDVGRRARMLAQYAQRPVSGASLPKDRCIQLRL